MAERILRSFQRLPILREAWNEKSKKRSELHYNSYGEKLQVKEFWIRKTCSNLYGEFVYKSFSVVKHQCRAMEPQWLMSTWILTKNKRFSQAWKTNQEIAKEINGLLFWSNVQFYSLTLEADWVAFCWLLER
jgi:hypothetical protein